MSAELEKKRSCLTCLKYLLIVINCFLMLIGTAIAGVFLWMGIDQVRPVEGVTGNNLAMVAVCLLVVAGVLLVFSTCVGIAAAAAEHHALTVVYTVLVAIILLVFGAASVCVAVFKTMLTEPVKLTMEESIRNNFGFSLDDSRNSRVTDAWNTAQIKWQCCAAADKSWAIYQESNWFKVTTGIDNRGTPWVPESCCERMPNGEIKDRLACLYTRPPAIGDQYAGVPAPVYQRGCYETLKDFFIEDQLSWFTGVFWVGIAGVLLMLGVLIIAAAFSFHVKRNFRMQKLRSSDFEFLSKSSVHSHLVLNSPPHHLNDHSPPHHLDDQPLSLRQTAPNQWDAL